MKLLFVMLVAVGLSACGNTISGIGQDIKDVGSKVTTWQNKKDEPKVGPKTSSQIEEDAVKALKKSKIVLKPEVGA